MNNWFSKLLADTNEQGRNTFRVVLTMLGGMIPALPLVIYLALQSGAWQLYVVLATLVGWVILLVISAALARQNRANLAMALIMGGLCVLLPALSALIAGLGLILSIAEVLAIVIVVGQTLSGPRATRALITAIVSAVLTLLIDSFAAWERVSHPLLQNSAPYIAVAVVLALGAYVLRQFREFSLRTKLMVAFTALAILSVGAVTFITDRVVRAQLTQQVGDELNTSTATQAQLVSSLMNEQLEVLKSFALSKVVQDNVEAASNAYTGDAATIQTQLNALDQQWRAADAAGDDNAPLVTTVLNSEVASELREFKGTFPKHVEVFVTDKYGANFASTNRTSDYYQADEDWWQAAYNNGQGAFYIGQPAFDDSAQTQAVIIALPLYGHGTQEVIGILRTTYLLDDIVEILAQFGSRGGADLLLPDGQILREEGDIIPLDESTLARLKENAASDFDQFVYDGTLSLVGQSPVVSPDHDAGAAINNLGWVMVLDEDPAVLLTPVNTATRVALITSLAVLAFAVVVALFLGAQFTNPIVRLTAVAGEIAGGNLTAQARVESNDEIGTLATTFNNMSAQLRNTLDGLEQRVAERTQSLELASEVGRAISQVRALDVMLKDAAELIRSQFDLYYVQVYLTDPSQTNLLLLSGTGQVGEQLVGRGHRLSLNTGSINGRAAIEKKSVVIADTTASATFRPNPLLPDTRSEMAIPLVVGEKVVGVLDLQSEKANTLSQELLPAFEALAGQLAIAIQNANLLAETEQARAEVEAQARRLVRANWADYMDAIHKPEETGFVFEQNKLIPLALADETQSAEKGNLLAAPIQVTGEALGNLVVEMDEQSSIARSDELVNTVARQVAQHIEELRLLESAERYRAEAEEASRRITREGWKTYVENAEESLSYFYDLKEVRPHDGNGHSESAMALPLKVRDEVLGKLAIQGLDANDSQALELVNAVAERLGARIENLRLLEQTQQRSLELEETQTFLDSVVENLPSMLFVKDASELRFVRWNKAAEDLAGFKREALIGKNDYDFFPKEEADFFTSNDRQVLVSGEMRDILEEPLATAHQGIRYLHTRKVPIYGLDGKAKYLLGVSEDITERKLAEEELRAREAQLSAALAETQSLYRINEAISGEIELAAIYQTVAQLSCDEMGFSGSWIAVYEPGNEALRGVAGVNLPEERIFASLPLNQNTPATLAAQTRQLVTINSPKDDERMLDIPLDVRAMMGRALSMPVMIGNELLGAIAVTRPESAADIGVREERMLQAVAVQLAVVMQRVKLFEQLQQQAKRESMLNIINQKIQSATSVEAVLQIAARELGHALGAPMTIAQLSMKDKSS